MIVRISCAFWNTLNYHPLPCIFVFYFIVSSFVLILPFCFCFLFSIFSIFLFFCFGTIMLVTVMPNGNHFSFHSRPMEKRVEKREIRRHFGRRPRRRHCHMRRRRGVLRSMYNTPSSIL